MICPQCGAENEAVNHYCRVCGAKLEEGSSGEKGTSQKENTQVGKAKIDPRIFIHHLDREALNALKSIPGFTTLLRAFIRAWSERQFKIANMSSKIRLSEDQMKKYHDMLLPICDKLDIDVPELYLELDVEPNCYTSGDTKPFIVMTSGLLETMPEELIPTVLAHECGHIVCHHVLYRTMGALILGGFSFMTGLTSLVTRPMEWAFAYWMRCSEFSADRAAILCDGSPDKLIRMCAFFSGYNKCMDEELNIDAFMAQAVEYKELIESSAIDKAMEFFLYNKNSHPLTAVRAYEGNEWSHTKQFKRALRIINQEKKE